MICARPASGRIAVLLVLLAVGAQGCGWTDGDRSGDPVDEDGHAPWRDAEATTPRDPTAAPGEPSPGSAAPDYRSASWPSYHPQVAAAPATADRPVPPTTPAARVTPTRAAVVGDPGLRETGPPPPVRNVPDEVALPWETRGAMASSGHGAGTAVPSQVVVPVAGDWRGGDSPPIRRVPVEIAVPSIDPETGLWVASVGTAEPVERPRSAREWLQLGWDRRTAGDLDGAEEAFQRSLEEGADPHQVAMELGYLDLERDDPREARKHFREAKNAAQSRADDARRAMVYTQRRVWFDLYGEGYGWHRFLPDRSTNLVPTLRLRVLWHPLDGVDLNPYLFVQASRDLSSRGASGPTGVPLIYADNSLMFGAGVLLRLWRRQVGLFAQVGPAINLMRDDGRKPIMPDFRAGAYLFLETPRCHPAPRDDNLEAVIEANPCAELYAEAVYVSRFEHNLAAMVRGRYAIGWLVTGPVAWQPIAEVRVFKDANNDYWNNLVDAGVGHRWRLLRPIGLDLMASAHVGSYFGLENVDPVPDPLYYAEFRFLASTYIVF